MCLERHQVREDYKEKIRLMTEENKTCKFLDYDCQKGIWQFEVNRFWDFWVGWLDLSGGWFLESSERVGDWVPTSPGTIRKPIKTNQCDSSLISISDCIPIVALRFQTWTSDFEHLYISLSWGSRLPCLKQQGVVCQEALWMEGLDKTYLGDDLPKTATGWWFGTWMDYDSPYIGNVITPTDELHHFSEG